MKRAESPADKARLPTSGMTQAGVVQGPLGRSAVAVGSAYRATDVPTTIKCLGTGRLLSWGTRPRAAPRRWSHGLTPRVVGGLRRWQDEPRTTNRRSRAA